MKPVWLFDTELRNSIILSSGTVRNDFDRQLAEAVGAVTLKSQKPKPVFGNPQPRICGIRKTDIIEIDSNYSIDNLDDEPGMVNRIGLQNCGVDKLIEKYVPVYREMDVRIIASIAGGSIADYQYVLTRFGSCEDAFLGYEVNVSCPNVKDGLTFGSSPTMIRFLVQSLRHMTDKPLFVKLSPNVSNICEIALAAIDAGADGLSLINTIKVKAKMSNGREIEGGLSGPMIFPIACRLLSQVREALPDIPIIAGGGVWCTKDVKKMLNLGATAVSVGTLNFTRPDAVLNLIEDYNLLF